MKYTLRNQQYYFTPLFLVDWMYIPWLSFPWPVLAAPAIHSLSIKYGKYLAKVRNLLQQSEPTRSCRLHREGGLTFKLCTVCYISPCSTHPPPPPLGRFDFPKFSLISAPGVSIILFCIKKGLGEVSNLRNKNCLDAKKVILYSKNGRISKIWWFYITKQAILHSGSF